MSTGRGLTGAIRASQSSRAQLSYVGSSRYASSSTASGSSTKSKAKAKAKSKSPESIPTEVEGWVPAVPAGTSKAYDLSLEYLNHHRDSLLSRIQRLQAQTTAQPDEIERLTIEAYVNDPSTRRIFNSTNGVGHMDKPIFRHLAERKWQKEGGLDLLMQRIHQMKVVPDLLPSISGHIVPLKLIRKGEVEPGLIQAASDWSSPPEIHAQLFHHSIPPTSTPFPESLFTLLVIDPDSPSHETQSFTQRIHYAKSEIPLSVLSGTQNLFDENLGKEWLSWEPPAPAQGTDKHRYVFILLRSSPSPIDNRDNFNLRDYLLGNNLSADDVAGITLIRSKWTPEESEYINQVHQTYRGGDAPVYGKPPKELKYGYPLSAKARRVEEIRQAAWEDAIEGVREDIQSMENIKKELA